MLRRPIFGELDCFCLVSGCFFRRCFFFFFFVSSVLRDVPVGGFDVLLRRISTLLQETKTVDLVPLSPEI